MKRINIATIVFYSIYAFFTLATIAALAYLLKTVNISLDKYERSLPKYKAAEIFEEYFTPCNFEVLYEMEEIKLSEYENKNDFVEYMKGVTDGKEIAYREVPAGNDVKKYIVTADNIKFSEFTLTKTGNPQAPENTWELNTTSTVFSQDESVAVKILSSSTLFINEIEITDVYITENDIKTESCKHMPEGVNGITYQIYKMDKLLLKANVKVIDRNGNESPIVYDEEQKMFVEQITYETFSEELKTLTENAVQTYAKYMTLDSSLYNVRKYFDAQSQIYTYIRTSDTWCYTPHIGYEFKDITFSELYTYDENTFSARYKCNHYVHRTKKESFLFPLDLTLYFKNINGTFYVYDMVSNY